MNNNNVKSKSGSHECHDWLSKQPIGHEFTFIELYHDINKDRSQELSMGVVTGFIARAKRMGMIEVIGSVKVLAKRKPIFKYRYVKKVDWKFKPPGIGSHPGREIMGRKHDKIDTPESLGQLIQDVDANIKSKGDITRGVAETLGIPVVDMPVSERKHDDMAGLPMLEAEIEYDQGSLSDQLVNLAIQVNALENRPTKSLSDYSTDELISELKTRLK